MEDYLSELNQQQRAAVEYCDGPQLVIAGAGSGKTRVLTYKIMHLLCHGYEPWRIMALTFTNKAAREMRERIERQVGQKTASRLWMGTFHSIFARILRSHADRLGYKSSFTIYDAADSKSLVKMIIKERGLDDKIYKPTSVVAAISWAKNALISPEDYAMDRELMRADARSQRPLTAQLYADYVNRCRVAGAMDFDDLLYYTNTLLRDNPDLRNHYSEFFRYVLVDEYQDTNFAQHMIVNQLTRDSGHVMMVGDDAQSIYSFRGADINNILQLQNHYPGLQTFKLERNYRSTRSIVEVANSLIAKNQRQLQKRVYSEAEQGMRPEVVKSYSDFEEGYLVANKIMQRHRLTGDPYDEFAILYRTNAQSRVLEESLRKRNIPYRIYGGLSFYQRKEVRDAIAYFRMAVNPDDDEALRRIINFPARGIGDTTVGKLTRHAIERGCSLWAVIDSGDIPDVNAGTRKKLAEFHSLINGFIAMNARGADAYTVASAIIERTKLLSMLLTDRTPESVSKQENLTELLAGVQQFIEEAREEGREEDSLEQFLATVSLATDQDTDNGPEERVTLMTVHAAKGLEFSNVFIVGVEEDLFPSMLAQDSPAEIEEERRLLYVAITRAKTYCMLSYAGSRYRNGMTTICRPSRFLMDIDRHLLKADLPGASRTATPAPSFSRPRPAASTAPASSSRLKPLPKGTKAAENTYGDIAVGTRISHAKFGEGTVTASDPSADRIVVNFDNTGERTLLLRYAKFTII